MLYAHVIRKPIDPVCGWSKYIILYSTSTRRRVYSCTSVLARVKLVSLVRKGRKKKQHVPVQRE